MINGLGIVGWGVGGIEAEAGMLGQPVYFLTPDVVGVHLTGSIGEGVTATDIALTVTQLLRKAKVVGKFVEFFGPGAAALPVVDRATIANMAPEYGATMGFFPIDEESVKYLRATGRTEAHCRNYENYYRAQNLFGIPQRGQIDYSTELELDLGTVVPSVAGPKRPQDRIDLPNLKREFLDALTRPVTEKVLAKPRPTSPCGIAFATNPPPALPNRPRRRRLRPSSIRYRPTAACLIAAITSCTNTSNPSVMLAAGLLAKKAVERGLRVESRRQMLARPRLARGHRLPRPRPDSSPTSTNSASDLVGYGCTTCIGNSGPLHPAIEEAITQTTSSPPPCLSGNRNFEARVHHSIKANFLMSPPLVVAFALAGRVDIDLSREPLGDTARTANRSFCAISGRLWPKSATAWQSCAQTRSFPPALPGFRRSKPASGTRSPPPSARSIAWDRN